VNSAEDAGPIREEWAVIGSLLQRPAMGEVLERWLRPDDFADYWMNRLYRALVMDKLYQRPEVVYAAPDTRLATLSRLVLKQMAANAHQDREYVRPEVWQKLEQALQDLVQPWFTEHPEGAQEYGRAVLLSKVVRATRNAGTITAHIALDPTKSIGVVAAAAQAGVEELADLEARWEQASPQWLTQEATKKLPLASSEVPLTPETDLLLATLVLNPLRVDLVRELLDPLHFGGEGRAQLYERILTANDGGYSLLGDTAIVTWALQERARQGFLNPAASRSEVTGQAAGVFRSYVRHIAIQGGTLISSLASRGAGSARQLISAGQRALRTVYKQAWRDPALRWGHAASFGAAAR
jgi:hypothetical protein